MNCKNVHLISKEYRICLSKLRYAIQKFMYSIMEFNIMEFDAPVIQERGLDSHKIRCNPPISS